MSLLDLLGDSLPSEESDSGDDDDFDPLARSPAHECSDGICYGVPYADESEEEGEAVDSQPSDEQRFSQECLFSPRVRELQRGALTGGDPASRTGLLSGFGPMLLHQTHSPHPERPARLVAIYDELVEQGLDKRARLVPTRAAAEADITLAHSAGHVRTVSGSYTSDAEAVEALGMDSDTYFAARDSGYAALLAAGSVVELSTRVAQGELRNALAVTRPPGHHCEGKQAMGFCLINNVCVATHALRQRHGVKRVMILDWDVHHGNGVQEIFERDPAVLYVSLHRYGGGFYPGTGNPRQVGGGYGQEVDGVPMATTDEGRGTSVNVAWSGTGYGDAEYLAAFDRLVMPLAREYGPELVLVSAGFDAAQGDPLGGMAISPTGYAQMTAALSTLAGGKLVVALEGGYNLRSISQSAAAVMRTLLGDPPPPLEPRSAKGQALVDIERTVAALAPFWASLRGPELRRAPAPPVGAERKRGQRAIAKRKHGVPWWWRYLR